MSKCAPSTMMCGVGDSCWKELEHVSTRVHVCLSATVLL